jgi:hypothetical protein
MQSIKRHGLRREAERHAAFVRAKILDYSYPPARAKAPSPLRSAGAVHDAHGPARRVSNSENIVDCQFSKYHSGQKRETEITSNLLKKTARDYFTRIRRTG